MSVTAKKLRERAIGIRLDAYYRYGAGGPMVVAERKAAELEKQAAELEKPADY